MSQRSTLHYLFDAPPETTVGRSHSITSYYRAKEPRNTATGNPNLHSYFRKYLKESMDHASILEMARNNPLLAMSTLANQTQHRKTPETETELPQPFPEFLRREQKLSSSNTSDRLLRDHKEEEDTHTTGDSDEECYTNLEYSCRRDILSPKCQNSSGTLLHIGVPQSDIGMFMPMFTSGKTPPPISKRAGPHFRLVDNPGMWHELAYQAEFDQAGQYLRHALPSGASPAPLGPDNKRRDGEWEFHYTAWETNSTNTHARDYTEEDLFPSSRKGSLCPVTLKRLGLTKRRMKEGDALFFHQCLLPMCDTAKTDIPNDPRRSYYSRVESWSNTYIYQNRLSLYDSEQCTPPISMPELVHFDGATVRDGVLGCTNGEMYRRWDPRCSDYDRNVAGSITHRRWLQVKHNYKLCDNLSTTSPEAKIQPRGYKFDAIFETIVANTNALTESADLDVGVSFITSPGSPPVICAMDVHRHRPRAYVHVRDNSSSQVDQMVRLGQKLLGMVRDDTGANVRCGPKSIFCKIPHVTLSEDLSNQDTLEELAELGLGIIMSCGIDELPPDIPSHLLHSEPTTACDRATAARFIPPILAVKQMRGNNNASPYEIVHTSFQSLYPTNITSVNSLRNVSAHLTCYTKGRGKNRKKYMNVVNNAEELFTRTRQAMNDFATQKDSARLSYRSRKSWHNPMLDAKAMAVVVAYDMYRECAEAKIEPLWEVKQPLSFLEFQDKLSKQMLEYQPRRRHYPGDSVAWVPPASNPITKVNITLEQFHAAQCAEGEKSRLCGDLTRLVKHLESMKHNSKSKNCAVCSQPSYAECTWCGVSLHAPLTNRGKHARSVCFYQWHSDPYFGLAVADAVLVKGRRKRDWTAPNIAAQAAQATYLKQLSTAGPKNTAAEEHHKMGGTKPG